MRLTRQPNPIYLLPHPWLPFSMTFAATFGTYAKLEAAMTEFSPEVVFHLAAQPLVRRSYADPLGTYSTNVMGTAHVLEAVRKTPTVRAVVCVTTDKCYQNQEWVWPYRETDASRRARPLFFQQGLRRDRVRGLPQFLLPCRPSA